MRLYIKQRTRSSNIRAVGMLSLLSFALIEQILLIARPDRNINIYNNIINIIIVVLFIRQVREVWMAIGKVIFATLPVLFILLAYNLVFSIIGGIFFSYNDA